MYKVLIRPLEVSDALTSYKWRNDPEIWKYTGSRPDMEITPEIESEWIKKVLKDSYSKRFAITANDKYIGNVQLTNIKEGQAQYHIFIGDKDFWGKGIAFSATKQIIRYAKNVLDLEKIFLRVKNQNKKAVSLYENCGFEIVSELEGEVTMSLALEKTLVPKVSVFCMVYNHEPYLKECLEGFLMQQCNFDFEIVIGEDFSTDNSRGIILEYANKYPGKFKLLLHDKNIGAIKNQRLVFENCIGEYIAMCEGDDYWTDPLKLQKQVDFLESNPEYYSCFSAFDIIRFDTDTIRYKIEVPQKHNLVEKDGFTFGLLDFQKYFIPRTLTGLFRKAIFEEINFYKYKHFRDLHLFYHLLKEHKAFYFNKSMGVFRVHPGGINSMKEGLNNNLAAYNCYKELYLINNDNFCRVKYFQSIHALLKFSIYNDFDGNTIKYKFDLYLKMIKLLRNFKEIKLMLSVFVLRRNFINK